MLFIYRFKILILAVLAEVYKCLINLKLISPKIKGYRIKPVEEQVIVTLTSYGRRVENVYYTIVSLLRQTMKPDMVILWLDYDNWNESNIPVKLKELKRYGLVIRFCKDLKSYKKLIPALKEFPEALLITCDDDLYYKTDMVENLVTAYSKDSTKIYAQRAHLITYNVNGSLKEYNKWEEEISDKSGNNVFPTSGGGTLYTRRLLYKDICNEQLFMKLSPSADDVWNFFMGLLNHTENVVLPYKGYIYLPLDVFYQRMHKGANLSSTNCDENLNDIQIRAIMGHYDLVVKKGKIVKRE